MRFRGLAQILDRKAGRERMELRHLDRERREVDAGDVRTLASHCFAESSASASDVQHALAAERHASFDVSEPYWVERVKRLELALRIPPTLRCRIEASELRGIVVGSWGHEFLVSVIRARQRSARARRSASSS